VKLPETKYLVIGAAVLLVLLYLLSKRKTAAQTTQIAPPGTTPPGTTPPGTTPPGTTATGTTPPAFVPTTQQTLAALMAQAGKNLGNAVNALKQPTIIKALPPGITPVGIIPFTEQ